MAGFGRGGSVGGSRAGRLVPVELQGRLGFFFSPLAASSWEADLGQEAVAGQSHREGGRAAAAGFGFFCAPSLFSFPFLLDPTAARPRVPVLLQEAGSPLPASSESLAVPPSWEPGEVAAR